MSNIFIPGLEPPKELEISETKARKKVKPTYFDAAALPDSPDYQRNAENAQTYIMYIIFPSWDALKAGIDILTGGSRRGLAKSAKFATISSIAEHRITGIPLIDFWKERLSMKKKDSEENGDEAKEPV